MVRVFVASLLVLFVVACSGSPATKTSAPSATSVVSKQSTLTSAAPSTPTATPFPTPTPTSAPQLSAAGDKSQYRPDVDIRELYKDLGHYQDWKLFFKGSVLTIHVQDNGQLWVQVNVSWPGGSVYDTEVLDLIYPANSVDSTGIVEGSNVAVWGRVYQTTTITNAYGGQVEQPLLVGDYIQHLP